VSNHLQKLALFSRWCDSWHGFINIRIYQIQYFLHDYQFFRKFYSSHFSLYINCTYWFLLIILSTQQSLSRFPNHYWAVSSQLQYLYILEPCAIHVSIYAALLVRYSLIVTVEVCTNLLQRIASYRHHFVPHIYRWQNWFWNPF